MSVGPLRLPVALPRITRVERDRVLAGVCSGIAEALAMDVTLVRLTFAVLAFASGAGIVAYAGAWALLPAPGEAQPPRRRRIAGTVLARLVGDPRAAAASGSPTRSCGRSP